MKIHKLLIIGSGPAGLSAGIYASRAQLSPLIFEGSQPGGQLMGTTMVENWPGDKKILGPELMQKMKLHAIDSGAQMIQDTIVSVNFREKPFVLKTKKNIVYCSESIIIATGATPKRLGCPGESEYWGKGVSTCAVCDGALYPQKKIIIVGGGDTAAEEASFMTKFSSDITIVHISSALTASAPLQKRVLENPAIKILYNATIKEIFGNGSKVVAVSIKNQTSAIDETIPTDAVFIAIGLTPNTAIFRDEIELDQQGYIIQKSHTQTSVPGVFVAGDASDKRYRQAVTSAGSGCMAALDVEKFLKL